MGDDDVNEQLRDAIAACALLQERVEAGIEQAVQLARSVDEWQKAGDKLKHEALALAAVMQSNKGVRDRFLEKMKALRDLPMGDEGDWWKGDREA